MDRKTLEMIESLRFEDPTLNKLMNTHQDLNKQVDDLNQRPHLTTDDTLELTRLKKEKLHVRDEIENIVHRKKSA